MERRSERFTRLQLYSSNLKCDDNPHNVTLFVALDTKNPPQTILRGIFVEHRRIELLTF